jgi:hydrogenase expression/formation protein HypC
MCLGVPGKIIAIVDAANGIAKVDVSGARRNISIALLEPGEAEVGSWVLIHVGFAISTLDEQEAQATYRLLQELGQAYADELGQEWPAGTADDAP